MAIKKNKITLFFYLILAVIAILFSLTSSVFLSNSKINTNFKASETKVEKEWGFNSNNEVGDNAWKGFIVAAINQETSMPVSTLSPTPTLIPGIADNSPFRKAWLTLETFDGFLNVENNPLNKDDLNHTTTLFNQNVGIDVSNKNTDLLVQVAIKGNFINHRGQRMTSNKAELTVIFDAITRLNQKVTRRLNSEGSALYTFVFPRSSIPAGKGKILGIIFKPMTNDKYSSFNLKIDRITILSK